MSSSSSGFLDILNPWNWSSKSRITGSDDSFIEALKLYPELWSDLFTDSKVLCCPVSGSLKDEITKYQLLSHVLIHQRVGGEFKTLRGENVYLLGSELVCGSGFVEPREVRILSVSQISDSNGRTASLFRISRPLVGGIGAVEGSDEMSLQTVFRYMTILRSFPETEGTFVALDEYIKEINYLGAQSPDGLSRIQPSLAVSLQLRWQRATDRLCRCSALTATIGSSSHSSKQLIGQVLESYLMHHVADVVYPWMCACRAYQDTRIYNYMETLRYHTQSDLGISSELQSIQAEAIKELRTLQLADTPVDKLLVLNRVVRHIRKRVDRNVERKFSSDDTELATDDIVLLIIWCLLQLQLQFSLHPRSSQNILNEKSEHHITQDKTFLADISYIANYHFNASSTSESGFTLCHFQVAVDWFTTRAEAFNIRKKTIKSTSSDDDVTTEKEQIEVDDVVPTSVRLTPPLQRSSPQSAIESKSNIGSTEGVIDETASSSTLTYTQFNTHAKTHSNTKIKIGDLLTDSIPPPKGINEISPLEVRTDPKTFGLEFFQSVCVVSAERNLDWIREVNKDYRMLCNRSSVNWIGKVEDDELHPTGTQKKIEIESEQKEGIEQKVPLVSPDITSVKVTNKKCETAGRIVGNTLNLIGPDSCALRGLPRTTSIPSLRTNKSGAVIKAAAAVDVFAAISEDGRVLTWGTPEGGRLGRGPAAEFDSFTPVLTPREVDGTGFLEGTKFVQVACGKSHMVAVTEEGEVFSWGDNRCAQLGVSCSYSSSGINGPRSDTDYGPQTLSYVTANTSTCSTSTHITTATLRHQSPRGTSPVPSGINSSSSSSSSSGMGGLGSIPSGSTSSPLVPTTIIAELSTAMACRPVLVESMRHVKVTSVSCGALHSLCLTDTGQVYSWGRAANGRLGQVPDKMSIPDNAVGRPGVVRSTWRVDDFDLSPLSPSGAMSLDLLAGKVENYYSFSNGENTDTQSSSTGSDVETVQEGREKNVSKPTTSSSFSSSTYVSLGNQILAGGSQDQIQKGTTPTPILSPSLTSPLQLMRPHTDAYDSFPPTPQPSSLHRVICVSAGFSHSLAVTADGGVFSWGCGTHGRLGHGSHCDEYLPRQVQVLTMSGVCVVSASAGAAHSMFLSESGLLFGCGLNSSGQVVPISKNPGVHEPNVTDKNSRLSILCPLPVPVYEQPSEEPGPLIPVPKGKASSLSSCAQSFDELTSEEQEEISDVCQDSSQDGYEEVKRREKKEEKKEDRETGEEKEEEEVEREKKEEERESSRVLTIPVKSVSCGDFHTAALTHTDRLYTWGSLSQLTGGPYKSDATVSLKGSPLQVYSGGNFTLVIT